MCAAPGMKTTHLAAVLKNQGTVYAVEKDPKRYKTLETMIADSGATCVKTLHKDVLECSAEDFPGVEYILVDPSCTGSGNFVKNSFGTIHINYVIFRNSREVL